MFFGALCHRNKVNVLVAHTVSGEFMVGVSSPRLILRSRQEGLDKKYFLVLTEKVFALGLCSTSVPQLARGSFRRVLFGPVSPPNPPLLPHSSFWATTSLFCVFFTNKRFSALSLIEIGDIAGVADVTIRQSYRLIYLRAAELFPSDFKFVTPVDKLPNLWSSCSS